MAFTLVLCCGLFLGWGPALAAESFVCAGSQPVETGTHVAAKIAGSRPREILPQGQLNVLTVFAQFANEAPSGPQLPSYARDLFNPERPGSFTHFYQTMSHGELEIRGTVLPRRYSSDEPASVYLSADPAESGDYGQFALEILRQVDEELDFGQFDNDGPDGVPNSGDDDGFVDYIFINLLSTPRSFIVGSATGVAGLGMYVPFVSADLAADGQPIRVTGASGHGAIQREGTFALTVGSMAHEFGHAMGLPDLYDVSFLRHPGEEPDKDSAGIGSWGLMGWGALGWSGGDGPNPFCAWSLEQLGWIGHDNDRLVEVTRDAERLEIADLHQGGVICKIPLPPENLESSGVEQGYLLLEQRVRSSNHYNRNLPGEGLLIWHVRPRTRNNEQEERKRVDLVCSDGLYADAGYPGGRTSVPYGGRDNLDFWAHDPAYTESHGGNWGDATDPFDGIAHTHFGLDTNPSSVIDPAQTGVTTGVSIGPIRRQGDAMVVDVSLARWAGTIHGEVRWAGEILVEGDLTVAPGARLIVFPGTRVLFAGTDRLRSGRDPDRCELHLRGDFAVELDFRDILADQVSEPVVFEALVPGETWHGIVADPASRNLVPAGALTVRDAQQGLALPEAPPGAQGLTVGDWLIDDEVGWETAGNGDGQLNPGESFGLTVELDNWSLSALSDVRIELSWVTPLLPPPPGSAFGLWRIYSEIGALESGKRRDFQLPVLTLSPEAAAGQPIDLMIRVRVGNRALREETRSFTIAGSYPQHEARLEVPGQEMSGQTALVLAERSTIIRASIVGSIGAAELLVRTLPDLEPVERIPMNLLSSQGDERRFVAPFRPASQGHYHLSLQVAGTEGATVVSPAELQIWAIQDPELSPALVLLDNSYTSFRKDLMRRRFSGALENLGLGANFLETSSQDRSISEALIDEYLDPDRLVIWIGEQMGQTDQKALRGFVQEGGRLLVTSRSLFYASASPDLLGESFHIHEAGKPQSHLLRSLYASSREPIEFRATFAPLDYEAPAEPVLVDDRGNVAGLRVDEGVGRVVYFSVDLGQVDASVREELIAASLQMLRQPSAEGSRLEVSDRETVGDVVLLPPDGAVSVRAEVTGSVASAELVVRSFPQLAPVDRIPMELQSEQDGTRHFVIPFRPPEAGEYYLSLGLWNADGTEVFSAASLRAWSPFQSWHSALLLLSERYSAKDRSALRALFAEALVDPDGGIDVMESPPPSENLYDLLFDEYLEPGEMVIWQGETMGEELQAAFRRYLASGGRLFVSSYSLHRYSTDIDPFLSEVLHTAKIAESRRDTLHGADGSVELFARYGLLNPIAPAEPSLTDSEGNAAALRVAVDGYRLVYLALDLRRVEASVGQTFVADEMQFLSRLPTPEANLLLTSLGASAQVAALRGVFEPRVTVANVGGMSSSVFRVGYQILQGERLVASAEGLEHPLAPHAEREIVLPAWEPIAEADFGLRLGVSSGRGDPLVFLPSRSLRIIDVRGTFDPVALPADPSKGNGAGFFDYDNDGDLDFYLVRLGGANHLYRNEATGLTEQAENAGLADGGRGRGLAIGDYDADGDVDLYLVNEGRNSLWRNEASGTFTETTALMSRDWELGTGLDESGSGRSAAFFDADGDGDLDLYLVNAEGVNRFFRKDVGGYGESGEAYGLADGGNGRGLAIGDYDGDGDADLFVANTTGSSLLLRNDTGVLSATTPRFQRANESVGLELAGGESAATFGDYDNDGDLDLFISNEKGVNHLYRNEAGHFDDGAAETDSPYLGQRTVGAAFCDYDNDGDLDLAVTAYQPRWGGDQLYQNRGGGGFVAVDSILGLSPESNGRAIAFADLDQDGSQDLLVADSENTRLYRNAASQAHWLQLDLQGSSANSHGLGARIALMNEGQLQYRDVQSGSGYGSQVQTRVHFGLGTATQVDSLQVFWPDGMESMWMGILADQRLSLAHPALITAVLEDAVIRPSTFQLQQNYPNPFNARTVIAYQLPQPAKTELSIYNTGGQLVRRLVAAAQPAGAHQAIWDGADEGGRTVGSGVYLYRLRAGTHQEVRRLLLLK